MVQASQDLLGFDNCTAAISTGQECKMTTPAAPGVPTPDKVD